MEEEEINGEAIINPQTNNKIINKTQDGEAVQVLIILNIRSLNKNRAEMETLIIIIKEIFKIITGT